MSAMLSMNFYFYFFVIYFLHVFQRLRLCITQSKRHNQCNNSNNEQYPVGNILYVDLNFIAKNLIKRKSIVTEIQLVCFNTFCLVRLSAILFDLFYQMIVTKLLLFHLSLYMNLSDRWV